MDKKVHFILFIALLCFVYRDCQIFNTMPLRPQGIHMWAMCDRASVARNYAEESMNFFKPRTNCTLGGDGVTGMEFPLVNYIAAILYKLFGFHEWLYRLVSLVIVSTGLFFASLMASKILNNFFLGISAVFLWMLSPTLDYYIPSFLPDTSSLGFVLIAWFFIFRYIHSSQRRDVYLFALFASLASLIKITSLISAVVILCLVILDCFSFFSKEENARALFKEKKILLLGISVVFLSTLAWYMYSGMLNSHSVQPVFTMAMHPNFNLGMIKRELSLISNWFSSYYSSRFFYPLFASVLLAIIFWRKVNRLLASIVILLYTGAICFFILMMEQFVDHDYYIIALLPAIFFHMVMIFDLVKKLFPPKVLKFAIIPALGFLILCQANYAKGQLQRRDEGLNFGEYSNMDFRAFYDIEPYMRKIGIKREDKVAVIYDPSMNISLYYMNVKGWSIHGKYDSTQLASALEQHVPYLVVKSKGITLPEKYNKYFTHKIGEYSGVDIFKPEY